MHCAETQSILHSNPTCLAVTEGPDGRLLSADMDNDSSQHTDVLVLSQEDEQDLSNSGNKLQSEQVGAASKQSIKVEPGVSKGNVKQESSMDASLLAKDSRVPHGMPVAISPAPPGSSLKMLLANLAATRDAPQRWQAARVETPSSQGSSQHTLGANQVGAGAFLDTDPGPCTIKAENAKWQQPMSGNVRVMFPYSRPLPTQQALMSKIIMALNNKQHALLESPTGTGKTAALLCSVLAWQRKQHIQTGRAPRIYYGTRTHSQIKQVVAEMAKLAYRPAMAVLGSRERYCVNEAVRNDTEA